MIRPMLKKIGCVFAKEFEYCTIFEIFISPYSSGGSHVRCQISNYRKPLLLEALHIKRDSFVKK